MFILVFLCVKLYGIVSEAFRTKTKFLKKMLQNLPGMTKHTKESSKNKKKSEKTGFRPEQLVSHADTRFTLGSFFYIWDSTIAPK